MYLMNGEMCVWIQGLAEIRGLWYISGGAAGGL